MNKVIGVISLKGGVGKTSIVANLGTTLVKEYKKKVLVIDANFSTPHLGIHLGFLQPPITLHHVLNGIVYPSQAIYEHPIGIHLIAGSLIPMSVNPLTLKEKVDLIKKEYDFVIIDSSPALNEEMYATMYASDEIIVVSSPDYPTLSSTLQAIKIAKEKKVPIRGIVINKVYGKKFEISKKDIEKMAEIEVLSMIPADIKVIEALSEMTPVVEYSPKREISKEFKKLAAKLMNLEEKRGIFEKAKKIFKRNKED